MRTFFYLALLSAMFGACTNPGDTDKTAEQQNAVASLPEAIDALLEKDDEAGLKALVATKTLAICDLALRNSSLDACTVLELACANGALNCVTYLLNEQNVNPNYLGRQGISPLHHAAIKGHKSVLNLLLEKGANPELTGSLQRRRPLHAAAILELPDCLHSLLSKHAEVNARSREGVTPLHDAVGNGCIKNIAALLGKGANLNAQRDNGFSVLHDSVWFQQRAATAFLLAQGASCQVKDKKGNTPLHLAARTNDFDAVKLLLFYGADPVATNGDGLMAEQVAATEELKSYITTFKENLGLYTELCDLIKADKQEALAALIQEKGISSLQDLNTEFGASWVAEIHPAPPSLLHLAIYWGAEDCAKHLLDKGYCSVKGENLPGAPALHWAVVCKKPALVQMLLDKGAAVSAEEPVLKTQAIHYALKGEPDILAKLLAKDASVSGLVESESFPLLEAAAWGDIKTVQSLLIAGADPLQKTSSGQYPLLASILYGNTAVTAYFLASGVSLDSCSHECLQAAAERGLLNEIKLLLGYSPNLATEAHIETSIERVNQYLSACKRECENHEDLLKVLKKDSAYDLEALLKGSQLGIWDALVAKFKTSDISRSVLTAALDMAAYKCATYLLNHFDMPLNSEAGGMTPLTALTSSTSPLSEDETEALRAQQMEQLVCLLLQKGARIDAQDSDGNTALLFAGSCGNKQGIEALLANGASPNLPENLGSTPLTYAIDFGQTESAKLLISHEGTDLDRADNYGAYPVYIAVMRGDLEALKALLEKGAKTYQEAYPDYVPLIAAVRFCSFDMVKTLIEHKADRGIADRYGETALKYARDIPGAAELVALLEGSAT